MKKTLLLFVTLWMLSTTLIGDNVPPRKEFGNLVVENVPDIPPDFAERAGQYENTRSAELQDWEPNGNGILITTRFANTEQVHFIRQPGGYRQQLTFFNEPVSSALYPTVTTREGFLFSMDEGGGEFFQLFWFDTNTGKYSLLTDGGRTRNVDPVWSNDGRQIAFSSTRRNGKDLDIYAIENLDPKKKKLLKQVNGSWEVLDWSPDNRRLILHEYISANESYLYQYDLNSGKTTSLFIRSPEHKIAYGTAAFARHADGIFYTSDEEGEFQCLYFHDLRTGKKRTLTKDILWDVTNLAISKDGNWIAFVANEDGRSGLYISETSNLSNRTKIEHPQGVISKLRFDPKSTRIAFSLSRPVAPADIYVFDLKSKELKQWTFSEVGGLNPATFVEPELVHYPTFDQVNGRPREIPVFYYRPRIEGNQRAPVIIHIHGGPESQVRASFNPLFQYWINELKAAVLAPNVRGSNGYGKNYLLLDNATRREESVKDIGKLLDWIATRPELDSKRVAVYGGSYGGYMVLSSMTHYNDRLRCAVEMYGISNYVTFLRNTEDYRRDLRRAEYGDEQDPKIQKFLESISPLTNAHRISKPLLVVQGKNDPRVPLTESEQLVKAVRKSGSVVWYIMAKDEGHGFKKKVNRDYIYNAINLFFQKHL
jgi:dipeptidyl aminopeptidase/acylaminoacyl peptidase